jgi:hypothetical protein
MPLAGCCAEAPRKPDWVCRYWQPADLVDRSIRDLSQAWRTMRPVAGWVTAGKDGQAHQPAVLLSHAGVPLERPVAFRFALDPTEAQTRMLLSHAGAARLAHNHHVRRVRANLGQRRAELSYDVPADQLTPPLSWSKVSFINEMNAWKTGRTFDTPANPEGSRGLVWRSEISADVFECASVNAAQALANFSNSLSRVRKGKKAGFPHFKSRRRTAPAFKLRSKSMPGQTAPIRVAGPKALRFPTLGVLRVHGCTSRVRRMLESGRGVHHRKRFPDGRWRHGFLSSSGISHPSRTTLNEGRAWTSPAKHRQSKARPKPSPARSGSTPSPEASRHHR